MPQGVSSLPEQMEHHQVPIYIGAILVGGALVSRADLDAVHP